MGSQLVTESEKIDFVVTWVDGDDKFWKKKKEMYDKKCHPSETMNSESRYRNYHIFKYWFRAVENYAPWVNKIFLITDQQIPEWLNLENEKIKVVDHTEFINKKFLPTFNSNVIELNIAAIDEVSEKFVLFNDDTFINAPVKSSDFFLNDLPRDTYAESPIISTKGSVAHAMVNDMEIINERFSKKRFYRKNWRKVFSLKNRTKLFRTLALIPSKSFSGMWNSHLPVAYLKDTFRSVWEYMPYRLEKMMRNKFRTPYDYNQWLMRYWQLASGNFVVQNNDYGCVFDLGTDLEAALKEIEFSNHKLICLNDTDNVKDDWYVETQLIKAFEIAFPDKSSFEK